MPALAFQSWRVPRNVAADAKYLGSLQEAELDRLYSRFPGGSVGWALLLWRLIDGIALIVEAVVVFGLGSKRASPNPWVDCFWAWDW